MAGPDGRWLQWVFGHSLSSQPSCHLSPCIFHPNLDWMQFVFCFVFPFITVGYVKTTSVEIDFNTLKNHQAQPAFDPEVYDDVDVASSDDR